MSGLPKLMGCTSDVARFLSDAGSPGNILWSHKLNGVRTKAVIHEGGTIEYLSRAGTAFRNFSKFNGLLLRAANGLATSGFGWPVIFDGEVVMKSGGGLSRVMRQLRRLEAVDDSDFRFVVFDTIPAWPEDLPQRSRLDMLSYVLPYDGEDVRLLAHHRGNLSCRDEKSILALMRSAVERGYEGLVLKIADAPYRATPSGMYWLKVKPYETVDLPVVGWIKGLGKHRNRLGALVCLLPNGKKVGVGTGFYDSDRERIALRTGTDPDIWRVNLPSMIEIRYQDLSDSGVPLFPVYVQDREDKAGVRS